MAVETRKTEVLADGYALGIRMLIISSIFLGMALVITLLISTNIVNPIKLATNIMKVVATGDFTLEREYYKTNS